jgi:signal transduction histidine kinase
MERFAWGLALGCLLTAAISAAIGVGLHRRIIRLQRRAKDAERLAELGTLTGGLAHEIKNPLSTIQLNLQLLQEDLRDLGPSSARLTNRLHTREREASRLRDILDDFLRYGGRMEIEKSTIDLNTLCDEMVDFFAPQTQLYRVHIRFKRFPEPVLVQADSRLIKQALLNLMLNATQAMAGGGGELILNISREPKEAVIAVFDTGPGIPPENQTRIFDAYYSTKKSGTGLGLAMTRRIAEEHAGRVTVASEVGKGSVFRIHLPIG